jgi:integrase
MAVFKKCGCTNQNCSYWSMKPYTIKKDANGKEIKTKKVCTACGSKLKQASTYTITHYVIVGGKRKKITETTEYTVYEDAKTALAVLNSGLSAAPAFPSFEGVAFDEYALVFKPLHAARIKDPVREAHIINHLIKFFKNKPLNSFLQEDLDKYFKHRKEQVIFNGTIRRTKTGLPYQQKKPPRKVRASTIGRELSVLRTIFRHARKNKKLHYAQMEDNPFFDFKVPVSREILPPWSMSDLERLFSGLSTGLRPLCKFIAETGCRIEEAMSLKFSQINRVKRNVVLVRTKSDKAEDTHTYLHLSDTAMEIILCQSEDNEYVFTNPRSGTRYKNPRTSFRNAATKAKLIYPDGSLVRPHDLRHIFLTALAEGGANDVVLMKISRHSDARSLRRYIHARDKVTEEAFRNINRA